MKKAVLFAVFMLVASTGFAKPHVVPPKHKAASSRRSAPSAGLVLRIGERDENLKDLFIRLNGSLEKASTSEAEMMKFVIQHKAQLEEKSPCRAFSLTQEGKKFIVHGVRMNAAGIARWDNPWNIDNVFVTDPMPDCQQRLVVVPQVALAPVASAPTSIHLVRRR